MTTSIPEYLTVEEIASALRVSKMTVYRMLHDGIIPHSRFGKSMRVKKTDMANYLRKQAAR